MTQHKSTSVNADGTFSERVTASGRTAIDVTKSDVTLYDDAGGGKLCGLYVGGAGTVRIISPAGDTSNWTMAAGGYIDCDIQQVMSAGTTATALVGLRN